MFRDPRVCHIRFTYTNYRGETRTREACGPFEVSLEVVTHHLEKQWILTAFDVEKNAKRSYAMKDMSDVRVVAEEDPYARCHDV